MSTRNMIAANSAIFRKLDAFCSIRFDPIGNAGRARWIATDELDRRFLKNAKLVAAISLAPAIRLGHYAFDGRSYVVASGLDVSDPPSGVNEESLGGGALTVFLADLFPTPSASTARIRDTVEVDDGDSNREYEGFEPEKIAALFPRIQVFSSANLDSEESYRIFFLLALSSKAILQLRDEQLVRTIRSLSELKSQAVPYETLCRSVLDSDPSAIFLALYRCLEALYAYSHAESLKASLKLEIAWPDLALMLEEVLDWHPREEQSLSDLLGHAEPETLRRLAEAFGEQISEGTNPTSFVAKRVYSLRNSVVHYRPFQQADSHANVDWNRLTEVLAEVIFDIYEKIVFVKALPRVNHEQRLPEGQRAQAMSATERLVTKMSDPSLGLDSSPETSSRTAHMGTNRLVIGVGVSAAIIGFVVFANHLCSRNRVLTTIE